MIIDTYKQITILMYMIIDRYKSIAIFIDVDSLIDTDSDVLLCRPIRQTFPYTCELTPSPSAVLQVPRLPQTPPGQDLPHFAVSIAARCKLAYCKLGNELE